VTEDRERGATLVLFVGALVVLLGSAAFAIDLGWLYYQGVQTQNAAEAAALAGVVHMPLPGGVAFGGSDAESSAYEIAQLNGYDAGEVDPQQVPGRPNRLRVEVETVVPTFFMRVFGIDTVTLSKDAIAEQLPPLKLGSDEPLLGNDPALPPAARSNFWLAINGDRSVKRNGDSFSTHCTSTANCSGTPNSQFRDPAYYYAVEVGDGSVNQLLSIDVYDPGFLSNNPVTGDANWGLPSMNGHDLTFTVYAPDTTPSDWKDNDSIPSGCGPHVFTSGADTQVWVHLCQVNAVKGTYVVKVNIDGGNGSNQFTLRGTTSAGLGSDVAVYGLGAMSLWSDEADTTAIFKIARVDEIYAGNPLVISAFDLGDVTSSTATNLQFVGEAARFECEYRVRAEDGSLIQDWSVDDTPSGAPCQLATSGPGTLNRRFNNRWVDFRFQIPFDYQCIDPTEACWWRVDYNFPAGSNVTERTTWEAVISGQPIHLIYEPAP
jgi:hypothetical protein